MKILNVRPIADAGDRRFRDVAMFDAEVADGLRLNELRLSLTRDGKRFVFSPSRNGIRFAQFGGKCARELADAAFRAARGYVANDLH